MAPSKQSPPPEKNHLVTTIQITDMIKQRNMLDDRLTLEYLEECMDMLKEEVNEVKKPSDGAVFIFSFLMMMMTQAGISDFALKMAAVDSVIANLYVAIRRGARSEVISTPPRKRARQDNGDNDSEGIEEDEEGEKSDESDES